MRKMIYWVLAVLVIVLAHAGISCADNLMPDPGFELSTANGTFPNSGYWQPSEIGGASCTTTSAHSGQNGLRVYTVDSRWDYSSAPFTEFTAQAGDTFYASGWARTPAGEPWVNGSFASIWIQFLSSNHGVIYAYESNKLTSANSDWTQLSIKTPAAPSNTQYVRFVLYLDKQQVAGQSIVNFDDAFLSKTFSVTYDGNGNTNTVGTVLPVDGSSPYFSGTKVTVLESGLLTKTGYTFSGWNTEADGSGASYAPGDTFTLGSAKVTMYAQWTVIPTYTVTYNGYGNTGGRAPVDSSPYVSGAMVTIRGAGTLTKTGYKFVGWDTTPNGNGANYSPGGAFTMGSANVTLYAQWTPLPTYTVTYIGNGNTGGTAPIDSKSPYISYPTVNMLGAGSLTKPGYTFAGWNTSADSSSTIGVNSFSMGSSNVTLYAIWTPANTVTYNGNGNTGGTVPVDGNGYVTGATVTVLGNTGNLTKSGYTFAGWNTAANGGGTSYAAGATFSTTAGVTLYATWTALPTYTVTYNGNGNTGGTAPVDGNSPYVSGATAAVVGNSGNLIKTGYTFSGWNTAANGGGTSYRSGATFTISANVMLYAQWQHAGCGARHWQPVSTSPVIMHLAGNLSINGRAAAVCDELAAFDATGALVGVFQVESSGIYGDMVVNGDSSATSGSDEGATSNEPLTIKVWDSAAKQEYGTGNVSLKTPQQALGGYTLFKSPLTFIANSFTLIDIVAEPGVAMRLNAGWNLLGWTTCAGYYETAAAPAAGDYVTGCGMTSSGISSVFSAMGLTSADSLVVVGPGGTVYMPNSPFNTLKTILPGRGYWVYVGGAKDILVPGASLSADQQLSLGSGWIQIGYWGTDGVTPTTAFACVNGLYDIITDETGKVLVSGSPFNTLKLIQKNKGYFLHTTAPATLGYQCN